MSIAIQSELTKQGGVVLIDELEQGLEPDRIITLVRILKEIATGQVFITTHSINVVLEAKWDNLFINNKGANTLFRVDKELDSCRRSNPQAFFAKKIICCEGKTEQGFIRAIDSWLLENHGTNFSAKGVVLVDCKGGNKMFTFAQALNTLGYETCIFADNDKSDELKAYKEQAINDGVKLFLCELGNCFEHQIINDLPWKFIPEVLNCSQEGFPSHNIQVSKDLEARVNSASDEQSQNEIRNEIVGLSIKKSKEWFKHIPGGEFLGSVFVKAYAEMDGKILKKNVESLLKWCGLKYD